jgi:hypothetical protein
VTAANVMLTVGLGSESTVVLGIIADGNVVCNVIMNKQALQDHIAILQRHADVLKLMPAEQSAAIN